MDLLIKKMCNPFRPMIHFVSTANIKNIYFFSIELSARAVYLFAVELFSNSNFTFNEFHLLLTESKLSTSVCKLIEWLISLWIKHFFIFVSKDSMIPRGQILVQSHWYRHGLCFRVSLCLTLYMYLSTELLF